ncbi:AraC family transcriptional regulator [Pedobacter caeni]|uniref:AraC-like ligand binding domain-containing protein n=1 Tax=Pedobacter caeni TaxID=288992 RepID=A0A1M5KTN3_9SPHI|nr:AraC family transcriptional regulator [Pedobacter caeni]SHG55879.1 AraC-like ligand binding domain-containing protein [Pedobacter caeni]
MDNKTTEIKKKEGFNGQKAIVLPRSILIKTCISNPLLSGIYLTDIGFYPKAKFHYRERDQGLDQYILIYCIDGKGEAKIGDTSYSLIAGNFIVIPADQSHSYASDKNNPWTIYWAHFKGHLVKPLITLMAKRQKGYKGFVQFNESRIKLFEDIYLNLERGYSTDNLCYVNLSFSHFLSSFIFDEKFNYSSRKQMINPIDVAIEFMQKNLHSTFTLEEVAKAVNLSPSHFSALFKEQTGFAPIKYFNHIKIQKACQYLQFTDLRIKEIAATLGIDDQYYFSRMFSKIMGVSPQDYKSRRETLRETKFL